MRRVLVTGARGFVGRHTLAPLAGPRHGFSTILDASTHYRALERTRFPLPERPTETTRCPADADPELLPELCQPNKDAP